MTAGFGIGNETQSDEVRQIHGNHVFDSKFLSLFRLLLICHKIQADASPPTQTSPSTKADGTKRRRRKPTWLCALPRGTCRLQIKNSHTTGRLHERVQLGSHFSLQGGHGIANWNGHVAPRLIYTHGRKCAHRVGWRDNLLNGLHVYSQRAYRDLDSAPEVRQVNRISSAKTVPHYMAAQPHTQEETT